MHRLILALALYSLSAAAPQVDPCDIQAMNRWNKFAEDANEYARKKNAGIRDQKLRDKLPQEWDSVMRCRCW